MPLSGNTSELAAYYRACKVAKPEPRKRTKARKDRTEAKVKRAVRAACVERYGYCRFGWDIPFSSDMSAASAAEPYRCRGVSE